MQKLQEDFDRILIDTTMPEDVAVRLAVASTAPANILVVTGDRGAPRSTHRRFAAQFAANQIPALSLLYLIGSQHPELEKKEHALNGHGPKKNSVRPAASLPGTSEAPPIRMT